MAKELKTPGAANMTGKAIEPKAPAPAPKASSDPAKASSEANIKTTFGTPKSE